MLAWWLKKASKTPQLSSKKRPDFHFCKYGIVIFLIFDFYFCQLRSCLRPDCLLPTTAGPPSLVSEDNGLAALDHKVAYQSSYQCIQCQLLIQLGTNVLPRTCFHCRILKKCRSIHEQLSFFVDAFPIGLKVYCIIPTSWVQTSSKSKPVDRHSSMGLSSLNGLKSSACEKFDWLIVSLVNQPIKRWISETRTFSATCFALKGEGGRKLTWLTRKKHGKFQRLIYFPIK